MAMNVGAWRWFSPSTTGKTPAPRASFASAVVNNTLFIAGGWDGTSAFDDAFGLDLELFRWREMFVRKTGNATLDGRILFGHASIGETLYIHGGTKVTNLADRFSDVLALDTASGELRTVPTSGDGPGGLMRHTIAARENSLWVVGGLAEKFSSAVHRLDILDDGDGGTWHRVAAEGFVPWPRAYHCLAAIPAPSPYLLLSGGGDGDRDFHDVYALDVRTSYWHRFSNITGDVMVISSAACGLLPLQMASSDDAEGHIDENARSALVMHGGFGGVGNNKSTHGRMNIARVLQFGTSTTSWRWSELKVSGSPTTARMNHRLHVINATCIITFGGSGDGEHLSDVSVGTPNRRRRAESASMLVGDPGNGALDSDANTLDDSDALESDANAFDESEYQVIRTVRTADKSKRVRKAKRHA